MRNQRQMIVFSICIAAMLVLAACAGPRAEKGRYNTQRGAAIGAALGAVVGQAIGKDTGGTLLGAGIGTVVGAIAGNAMDQDHAVAREAAEQNKRVVYYEQQGGMVEAIPEESQQTDCRKVTKRIWKKGELMEETVEEVCEGEKQTNTY